MKSLSDNPLIAEKAGLERDLETLPEEVAVALVNWRQKMLDRQKCEALKYMKTKMENPTLSSTDIKHIINANEEHYAVALEEAKAEANYNKIYETLMAKKLLARMRTAF